MISDTLRQKYLYATPFADDGFPLVRLDDESRMDCDSIETISGSSLYHWEQETFDAFVTSRKGKIAAVLIEDDLCLQSNNPILKNGVKCFLMSFAYHFKKAGFQCAIKAL